MPTTCTRTQTPASTSWRTPTPPAPPTSWSSCSGRRPATTELRLQITEPERALRQCVGVPALEVERVAVRGTSGVATGEPRPLTQLVRRRLRRPRDVAQDLAVGEGLRVPA